jgi:hypothetical protein
MVIEGERVTFKDIPVYDAPTFITDRSALKFEESSQLVYERTQTK